MAKKKGVRNPEMGDAGKNWNVVTGCDKYSDGCLNCYAEDVVEWLKGMGQDVLCSKWIQSDLSSRQIGLAINKSCQETKETRQEFCN